MQYLILNQTEIVHDQMAPLPETRYTAFHDNDRVLVNRTLAPGS